MMLCSHKLGSYQWCLIQKCFKSNITHHSQQQILMKSLAIFFIVYRINVDILLTLNVTHTHYVKLQFISQEWLQLYNSMVSVSLECTNITIAGNVHTLQASVLHI